MDPDKQYLINVRKIVESKEKVSIVDVRDLNWEKINGVWENDTGWEPLSKEDVSKLEDWIKKSTTPIKESPLAINPKVEESWKEVVQEQKKTEEKFLKEGKLPANPLPRREKKKRGGKALLIYSVISSIAALGLGIVYLKLVPDIGETKKFIDSFSESPINTEEDKKEIVMDSNKAYFMKYIIEESIWRAKVKASLYKKAQGITSFEGIKDYTNIYATATEVVSIVNKMFEKFNKKSSLSVNDLKKEIELFEKALSSDEQEGKKTLCYLTKSAEVRLGTYPSKKVAERANKEKWISPLGSLHEATTGVSQRARYTTDPNDPRSVGEPVTWKPLQK